MPKRNTETSQEKLTSFAPLRCLLTEQMRSDEAVSDW